MSSLYLFLSNLLPVHGISKWLNVWLLFRIHLRKRTVTVSFSLVFLLLLSFKYLVHYLVSIVHITPTLLFLITSVSIFWLFICIAFITRLIPVKIGMSGSRSYLVIFPFCLLIRQNLVSFVNLLEHLLFSFVSIRMVFFSKLTKSFLYQHFICALLQVKRFIVIFLCIKFAHTKEKPVKPYTNHKPLIKSLQFQTTVNFCSTIMFDVPLLFLLENFVFAIELQLFSNNNSLNQVQALSSKENDEKRLRKSQKSLGQLIQQYQLASNRKTIQIDGFGAINFQALINIIFKIMNLSKVPSSSEEDFNSPSKQSRVTSGSLTESMDFLSIGEIAFSESISDEDDGLYSQIMKWFKQKNISAGDPSEIRDSFTQKRKQEILSSSQIRINFSSCLFQRRKLSRNISATQ